MNYTEIKEKYPKSFEVFCEWNGINPSYEGLSSFHAGRDLYDFFDQNRILVNARYDYIRSDDAHFDAEILDQATGVETYSTGWLTRPEAETAGFMKAFEILEERINKQKQ